MTKRISLTQEKFALVDDKDYEWINQNKWCAAHSYNNKYYAIRNSHGPHYARKRIIMHREIYVKHHGKIPPNRQIDHVDGNGLNNSDKNLRLATSTQNQHNSEKTVRKTYSRYKGVTYNKYNQKWQAEIVVKKKLVYLGQFSSEIGAAEAYNQAASKYFGEFARLNTPEF